MLVIRYFWWVNSTHSIIGMKGKSNPPIAFSNYTNYFTGPNLKKQHLVSITNWKTISASMIQIYHTSGSLRDYKRKIQFLFIRFYCMLKSGFAKETDYAFRT